MEQPEHSNLTTHTTMTDTSFEIERCKMNPTMRLTADLTLISDFDEKSRVAEKMCSDDIIRGFPSLDITIVLVELLPCSECDVYPRLMVVRVDEYGLDMLHKQEHSHIRHDHGDYCYGPYCCEDPIYPEEAYRFQCSTCGQKTAVEPRLEIALYTWNLKKPHGHR